MNIVDVFGFKFDKDSGIMYDPKMNETGYTFFDSYLVGPGILGKQDTGIVSFATLETAQQIQKLVQKQFSDYKVEVVDTDTDNIFKYCDKQGNKVPQYQIKVSDKSGSFSRFNAGLVANQLIRNPGMDVSFLSANLPKSE